MPLDVGDGEGDGDPGLDDGQDAMAAIEQRAARPGEGQWSDGHPPACQHHVGVPGDLRLVILPVAASPADTLAVPQNNVAVNALTTLMVAARA